MLKQNWEERFEKEIICHCDDTCEDGLEGEKHTISNPEKIKSFISKLLSQTEQEVKERILKALPKARPNINPDFDDSLESFGFNDCLEEVKEIINK